MQESLMIAVLYTFMILFFVYLILAVIHNWKAGMKEIAKAIFRTPVRLLLAAMALYGIIMEWMMLTLIFSALLFLQVYFISKEDRDEIKKLRKEMKERKK